MNVTKEKMIHNDKTLYTYTYLRNGKTKKVMRVCYKPGSDKVKDNTKKPETILKNRIRKEIKNLTMRELTEIFDKINLYQKLKGKVITTTNTNNEEEKEEKEETVLEDH